MVSTQQPAHPSPRPVHPAEDTGDTTDPKCPDGSPPQGARTLGTASPAPSPFCPAPFPITPPPHLSSCFWCFSSRAWAFICCTSMVSGFRRRMYSSWFPMQSCRIRLLIRRRGA